MRSNAGLLLIFTTLMCSILYLFAKIHYGSYHDKPMRYGPLIPHMKSLFREFCEIRNNQSLNRMEADARIDQLINEKGPSLLLWAYDSFKIERQVREKHYWKRHKNWLKDFSDDAKELDKKIQEVRSNLNLTYAEECKQVNDLKLSADEHIRLEMQLRIEDCKEFMRVRPQIAKNRCYAAWSVYPIYGGAPNPERLL